MLKKILGDSPVTSIVGILTAFLVVLNEQLAAGEVTLVNALIAAVVAVVGRFLPDGPLKVLVGIFTPKSVAAKKPAVDKEPAATIEEPAKVEKPNVAEVSTQTVKKTKK